ncbi:cyclin-like protein [Anaeromyces robustus]|uniref:Cyclin-like protein n=1 Tax=Anaeromyces robustus TaxID=1754192 RepID=A0A1Y1X8C1_9FUNG|nr:cyclin-like protein [Anaeromyces robustus]|eukprot:ORX82010.1 cyclin-like protein [Anaeromyces robustus]
MESSIVIPSNISINKNNKNLENSNESVKLENEDSPNNNEIPKNEYESFHLANLYEQTSQYRHWLFTKEELNEIREEVNKESIEKVGENIKKEWEYQKQINNNIPPLKPINFLTVNDQKLLALFYETKISDYCKFFKFSRNVLATSIVYFKRFYLYCSMMQYAPKNIVLTCLFLACKSENSYIALDEFLAKVPKGPSPDVIKELELTVSQYIRFEYSVQSPFWALHGFYLDIQAFLNGPDKNSVNVEDNSQRRLNTTFETSCKYAFISLYGDLIFLYWPSQIALACLVVASKNNSFTEDLERYIFIIYIIIKCKLKNNIYIYNIIIIT